MKKLFFFFFLIPSLMTSQDFSFINPTQSAIHQSKNWLSESEIQQINEKIRWLQDTTKLEFRIVLFEGQYDDIETSMQLNSLLLNSGLIYWAAIDKRHDFIAVDKNWEGIFPDIWCGRITRDLNSLKKDAKWAEVCNQLTQKIYEEWIRNTPEFIAIEQEKKRIENIENERRADAILIFLVFILFFAIINWIIGYFLTRRKNQLKQSHLKLANKLFEQNRELYNLFENKFTPNIIVEKYFEDFKFKNYFIYQELELNLLSQLDLLNREKPLIEKIINKKSEIAKSELKIHIKLALDEYIEFKETETYFNLHKLIDVELNKFLLVKNMSDIDIIKNEYKSYINELIFNFKQFQIGKEKYIQSKELIEKVLSNQNGNPKYDSINIQYYIDILNKDFDASNSKTYMDIYSVFSYLIDWQKIEKEKEEYQSMLEKEREKTSKELYNSISNSNSFKGSNTNNHTSSGNASDWSGGGGGSNW